MNTDIHTALIDRQNELTNRAEILNNAAQKIIRIKNLEIELKMPNATVINRAQKEEMLAKLKLEYNDLQIITFFSHKI